MPDQSSQRELFVGTKPGTLPHLRLCATIHEPYQRVQLTWIDAATGALVADVQVTHESGLFPMCGAKWSVAHKGKTQERRCMQHRSSIRAELTRLRNEFPVADADISAVISAPPGFERSEGGGPFSPMDLPDSVAPWLWIERQIGAMVDAEDARFNEQVRQPPRPDDPENVVFARRLLGLRQGISAGPAAENARKLRITLNYAKGVIELTWAEPPATEPTARLRVRCTGRDELTWELQDADRRETDRSTIHRNSIRARLKRLQERFPVAPGEISATVLRPDEAHRSRIITEELGWGRGESPWARLEEEIAFMGQDMQAQFAPMAKFVHNFDPQIASFIEREARRAEKERQKHEELLARIRENQQRQREEQQRRERERQARAAAQAEAKAAAPDLAASAKPAAPIPDVPVTLDQPKLELQETLLPLESLRNYFLRERAALWWVSNQSDDLLSLPHCNIQRLEYQIRTALRTIGPLRGRALLSDEVGLGKTIEAGLVLKEYLTRGMVKRFLVVTVPSLVDQWEEELSEKFHLNTVTTNTTDARSNPDQFWRENSAIIASLHTLKQPAHLAVAQTINWDMLIIDEAHYLRNRTSQAWQAVNALPRQFLLLLTATPVQNSLEELYNLVTLLQPGQLPSPKEFRARFIDPKKPHQPREPDELRRLLGQVMIRNTRANAGITLPSRRAETALFEPGEAERAFWQKWEGEFRQSLGSLSASQASLWGRLLLQTAGSSPAAWREALKSFPDRTSAKVWVDQAPLEESWKKKCELLVPLTKGEGGVVIFSQYLQTQAAIASELRAKGVPTFVIHGQTPAVQRQPITEEFRQNGGALLLTHSGTEGRNLQFSHRLVNFDLPWNPMEIEQRIGRLHRIGQQHPVRIYNLVQSGTLQEHLLQILQEKLNLFELVVGETGLILGERYTSDEFAEEILRRWRESEGRVAEAMQSLGNELAAARQEYGEVKQLDETLFAKDYESL